MQRHAVWNVGFLIFSLLVLSPSLTGVLAAEDAPRALYQSAPSPAKAWATGDPLGEKLVPNEIQLYGGGATTVGGFEDAQGQAAWQGWTCHDLSDWHGVVREVVIRESYPATTLYDRMEAFHTGHPLVSAVYRVQSLTPGMTSETALILVGWPEVALTGTEISVLQSALAGGGAVVFVGERGDVSYDNFNANINAALAALGSNLNLGVSGFNSNYHVASRANGQVLDHPDIGQIDNVSYAWTGHILGSLPAERLFLTTSLVDVWGCVQDIGGGKVWTFADGSVWDHAYLEYRGNAELATRFLKPRKLVGAFCKIFDNMSDADPLVDNFSQQMTFIDDGTPPLNYPGESTGGTPGINCTYGIPGGYVVNTGGGLSNGTNSLYNEIWSPVIPLDVPGADSELLPRTLLRFEVYMDAPLDSGVFYTWRIRSKPDYSNSFNYGGWSSWRNEGVVYSSNEPRYIQREIDLTSLIVAGAEDVQIALGVIDQSDYAKAVPQGACPGPWFDNVSVVQAAKANNYDDCPLPILPQDYSSAANSSGYWFVVPRDMVIGGVRVPTDASSGDQSVEIVRINETDEANFAFPVYTGNLTSLFYVPVTQDSGILPVNIAVRKGEKIGVFGGRTDDQSTLTVSFSNGPTVPFVSRFANEQTTIYGIISNENSLQSPAGSLSSSTFAQHGRVELYIDQCDDLASCNCPVLDQAWALAAADTGSYAIGPRWGYAMAHDPDRRTTVLFGGDYGGGRRADVWELTNGVWAQVHNGFGTAPSPRVAAEMAYDSDRRVMVLYGGSTNDGPSGETWEWANGVWTQITTATSEVRSSFGMAYDKTRGVMVRYGGNGVGGRGRTTFEYDGTTWSVAVASSHPAIAAIMRCRTPPSWAESLCSADTPRVPRRSVTPGSMTAPGPNWHRPGRAPAANSAWPTIRTAEKSRSLAVMPVRSTTSCGSSARAPGLKSMS